MPEAAILILRSDLDKHTARLNEVNYEIHKLTEESEAITKQVAYIQDVLARASELGNDTADEDAVETGEYTGMTVLQVVEAVLRAENRPMKLERIVEAASAGGFKTTDNATGTFSSILSKYVKADDAKIVKCERGVFALREWPGLKIERDAA